jgi:hypothetical protein
MDIIGTGDTHTRFFAKFAVWEIQTDGKAIVRLTLALPLTTPCRSRPA